MAPTWPVLEQQRAGKDEPIAFVLHLACPQVEYTDPGKSAVAIHQGQGEDGGPHFLQNGASDETA
jgi:hypothetical protein